MRKKANEDIRQYAAERGVRLWELGAALGHRDDSQTTRWLRHELGPVDKARAVRAIDEIAAKEE